MSTAILGGDVPSTPQSHFLSYSEKKKGRIQFPPDDVINNFSVPDTQIFKKLREMEGYEKQDPNLKAEKPCYVSFLHRKIIDARRDILCGLLPARMRPAILHNAEVAEGVEFQDPIPEATLYYIRGDMKRLGAIIYDKDGVAQRAYDTAGIWKVWKELLTPEHKAYIDSKHKPSESDDRLYRGWDTSVVEMRGNWYVFKQLIPGYYRETQSKDSVPKELKQEHDRIKMTEEETLEEDYDAPKPEPRKRSSSQSLVKREPSNVFSPYHNSRESNSQLSIFQPGKRINHDEEESALTVSQGESIYDLLMGKMNDPSTIRDKIFRESYQMSAEGLKIMSDMQNYIMEKERSHKRFSSMVDNSFSSVSSKRPTYRSHAFVTRTECNEEEEEEEE